MKNPSWSELWHFVHFLSIQLSSCEKSVYCNEVVGKLIPGLKTFVVKFMVRMSKVSCWIELMVDFLQLCVYTYEHCNHLVILALLD